MKYRIPRLKIKNRIILASASPRRAKLLRQMGLKFIICPSHIKEMRTLKHGPAELVKKNALRKAKAVAKRFKKGIVLGADTVVFVKGRIVGKPKSFQEAEKFLDFLSRYPHWVYSGIAIIDIAENKCYLAHEKSKIVFHRLSKKDIVEYLSHSLSLDRAGGIDIEGKAKKLVKEIKGDFYNIVGLPVRKLVSIIRKIDKEN
ncbi:MAG: nucleoside triphosphate pyrophosphatase [Candidatus Omnitrophota bacterium]